MTVCEGSLGRSTDELPGEIVIVEEAGIPVARLRGDIDSVVVAAYDRREAFPAVIDASGVTFLDCSALGFLIRQTGAARRAGRRPLLRRPPRIVRRVIDLAEARDLFTVTA
jgi:anti-anti-sigma factor